MSKKSTPSGHTARTAATLATLATLSLAAVAQTSNPAASLSIQVNHPAHAVSPMLYGMMTEEINYSYDGGLYAEMVRNRTFMHDWSGIGRWNLEDTGTGLATMSTDTTDGPSDALNWSARLDIKNADPQNPAGIRNEGYWGMALQPDTAYNGSLYAKADADHFGPITISLINDITGKAVASTTLPELGTTWKRYEYKLTTGKIAPSANNHLLISTGHTGKLWLQLVSLFPPTYRNRANGNRTDLMEMLGGLHPKFLRMPGGNYLEGDKFPERFDWKATIGPMVDRPTHRSPWNYQSTDGLGLLEFLEWTEDLHIEPVLAVFAGYTLNHDFVHAGTGLQPYVDDAMDELEFTTGDTSTKWGAVRAKLGHPAPFPLHYVEIGNEDEFDHSGSYEGRYKQFYKAIKAKYPNLQLIATTPVKSIRPDVIDDHYYKRADDFFDFNKHYDDADRNGPKIFVGEWATREGSPTTNLGAALADASWMTAMERNSDLIAMASYAPLLVNVNPGGMQWESNLIGYNAEKAYGSPSYYAQSLFGEYLGNEYLSGTAAGAGTRFFYSATSDSAKGKVFLKLVNASSRSLPVHIALDGAASVGKDAELITLSGTNTAETNTIDDPKRIAPVKSSVHAGASFEHTMPPFSIQVVVLNAR